MPLSPLPETRLRAPAGRAADLIAGGIVEADAIVAVAQGGRAGNGGTDEIALNHIAAAVLQVNAGPAVARDHVAIRGIQPANPVARRAVHPHPARLRAGLPVAEVKCARGVGANEIAFDDIRAARRLEVDAGAEVAVDDQAANRACPRR